MFQKILVPINPLEDNEDIVVETAALEGIKNKAEIHLIYFGENKDSISKLEYYVKKCQDKKVKAIYKTLKVEEEHQKIPEAIASLSKNYDLIIMGHRKFDKIYRFVHQSTTADIINLVSIPVMIIPEENEEEQFAYKTRKSID